MSTEFRKFSKADFGFGGVWLLFFKCFCICKRFFSALFEPLKFSLRETSTFEDCILEADGVVLSWGELETCFINAEDCFGVLKVLELCFFFFSPGVWTFILSDPTLVMFLFLFFLFKLLPFCDCVATILEAISDLLTLLLFILTFLLHCKHNNSCKREKENQYINHNK